MDITPFGHASYVAIPACKRLNFTVVPSSHMEGAGPYHVRPLVNLILHRLSVPRPAYVVCAILHKPVKVYIVVDMLCKRMEFVTRRGVSDLYGSEAV